MSDDIDSRLRHLLLIMGVSSAVAKAFIVAAQEKGWPRPDQDLTEQAFAVIGPMMLSGLPDREVVEQLEAPFPSLYIDALAYCQSTELDAKDSPRGAARLPAWAFRHTQGRLAAMPGDRDFLELIQRYFGSEELRQMVAQMAKPQRS